MRGRRFNNNNNNNNNSNGPDVSYERLLAERRRRTFSGAENTGHDSEDGSAYDKDRIEVRNGYPVRYKCLNAIQEQLEADLIEVSFLYELLVSVDSSLVKNMQALEWSILWNVVYEIGLNRCDFEKQADAMRRTMPDVVQQGGRVVEDGDIGQSLILSLSSDGADTIDKQTGSCKYTSLMNSSSVCIPVRGSMLVLFTGNQPDLIERFLIEEIRTVMSNSSMLVEDVQGVYFLGRESPKVNASVMAEGSSPSVLSSNTLLVSVSIGVVAVILISLLIAVAFKRRKRSAVEVDSKGLGKEIQSPGIDEVPTTSTDSSEFSKSKDGDNAWQPKSNVEPWEPLQPPMDVEHQGVIYTLEPGVSLPSVHLGSTRHRKRKKALRRRQASFPGRASAAPYGIESIPETDGDSGSALSESGSPESACSGVDENERDIFDQLHRSPPTELPNSSPPPSPYFFYSGSTSPETCVEESKVPLWTPSFD